MENRNCKKCGKVFRYVTGYPLCNECKIEDEKLYKRVREYIRLNPGVNLEDVANALELSPRQVLRYLREERLEISGDSGKFLLCEFCGKVIRTGRFCETCKRDINIELNREPSKNMLGDTYYYNEDEEKKISNLREKRRKNK